VYDGAEGEQSTEEESDTETMVGGGASDEDDEDRSREDLSETPRYEDVSDLNHWHRRESRVQPLVRDQTSQSYTSEDEEADDDDSEAGQSSIMDRDGDTEMSVSPGALRGSRSVSISSDGNGHAIGQNLGVANEIHEIDDDSSDSSIRLPPGNRRRRYHQNPRVQQYDPRISMMFAQHQQSIRGAQSQQNDVEELESGVQRIEPASRTRRMTAYRILPPRRADPLRSSRSPSATGVISSTNRTARAPRQYTRRAHN
jgi:hypothetical protein